MKNCLIYILAFTFTISLFGCKRIDNNKPIPKPKNTYRDLYNLDFKGREIKILGGLSSPRNGDCSLFYEKLTINHIKDLENKYKCKLTSYDRYAFENIDSSVLSGLPIADICEVDYNLLDNSIASGEQPYLIPLDKYKDILELENKDIWSTDTTKKYAKMYHNMYFICRNQPFLDISNEALIFNKTLLQEEGLWKKYNIYDMQKNKTWTWNAFKYLCEKITKDSSGDGYIDRFGYAGLNTNKILYKFIQSNLDNPNNAGIVQMDENLNAKITLEQPNKKTALQFLNSLNKCFYSQIDGFHDLFTDGRILFGVDAFLLSKNLESYGYEFGVATMPIGPDNSRKINYYNSAGVSMGITRNSKDPEALAFILKELFKPDLNKEDMLSAYKECLRTNYKITDEDLFIFENRKAENECFRLQYSYLNNLDEVLRNKMSVDDYIANEVPKAQYDLDMWRLPVRNRILNLKNE